MTTNIQSPHTFFGEQNGITLKAAIDCITVKATEEFTILYPDILDISIESSGEGKHAFLVIECRDRLYLLYGIADVYTCYRCIYECWEESFQQNAKDIPHALRKWMELHGKRFTGLQVSGKKNFLAWLSRIATSIGEKFRQRSRIGRQKDNAPGSNSQRVSGEKGKKIILVQGNACSGASKQSSPQNMEEKGAANCPPSVPDHFRTTEINANAERKDNRPPRVPEQYRKTEIRMAGGKEEKAPGNSRPPGVPSQYRKTRISDTPSGQSQNTRQMKTASNSSKSKNTDIPIIKDVFGPKDFLIRRSSFSCTSHGHTLKNITAMVDIIDGKGQVKQRGFTAGYCPQCNRYYILESVYERISHFGVPVCRISDEKQSSSSSTKTSNGMNLAAESLLRQHGYNVSQQEDLSPEARH